MMTERLRSASDGSHVVPKTETDLSPKKTMLVLVIVVGCFAVLWPKVFYPMLVGSANQHMKPSPIDKTTGCCDVISEIDVNTIKIMSELCGTFVSKNHDGKLSGKELVKQCRQEVLETCGIDISVVLQERVSLGQSVKQILDEIRSLNGSLCLKYNFGVSPWKLGVPHRVTVKLDGEETNIRQERPHHLRSELIHPAFRERGRAIPQPQVVPAAKPASRVVEGRPGPLPGMRPTLGGAGHVVPPPKQGTSSMSIIMPIYTIGIVIFFTYTLMKIIFRKQPEGVGGNLYAPIEPDQHFRKEVFESESNRLAPKLTRENISTKLVVNAMSALLDEVDQEIEARRKGSEVAAQDLANGTLSNGNAVKPQDEEQPTVKVLGMEMTASCEGGKKWSRPDSPVLPTSPAPQHAEPASPPQEIYLEGALPAQSHLLVADSATEPEPTTGEDPAVVLSGKMTLSVISLDSENGVETTQDETVKPVEDLQVSEVQETQTSQSPIQKDIEEFLQKLRTENEVQAPTITLESEDTPQTLEVAQLEKEVDNLILEAIGNIQQRETDHVEVQTNEVNDNNLHIVEELTQLIKEKPQEAEIKDIAPAAAENGHTTAEDVEKLLVENGHSQKENEAETNGHTNAAENIEENGKSFISENVRPAAVLDESKAQLTYDDVKDDFENEVKNVNDKIEPVQKTESSNGVGNAAEAQEQKQQTNDVPSSNVEEDEEDEDEDELASDEEIVEEEIEEIVYEEESEEDEEQEENVENGRNVNTNESSSVHRVNGERSEDRVEESRNTSGNILAENDISDEELTDDEEDSEEIIEVEEIVEDDDYIVDEANDLNHVSGESDLEL